MTSSPGLRPFMEHQLVPVALPESFARRFGQVVEVNPVVVTGAGIARKLLPADISFVIHLSVEDAVGIVDVRPPEYRLGGGRINRQSDLPAPLDFGLVFVNVGQSVIVDRLKLCRLPLISKRPCRQARRIARVALPCSQTNGID